MEIKSRRCDSNKSTVWYKGDRIYYHREDGPARIYDDGEEFWYYNNRLCYPEEMPLNLFLAYCRWEYNKQ